MSKALLLSFMVVLLASSPIVFGVDHIVGDSGGWSLGNNFSTWASGKTFKVGDNLVFIYDSSHHQVDQVDESDYKGCSASNSIKNYQDGNSKVPLTKSGNFYFICPTPGHCAAGMKLQVTVVAAAASASTTTPSGGSPTTAPSNSSPYTPSESGTPPQTAPSNPYPYIPSESGTPPTTAPSNPDPYTPSGSGTPPVTAPSNSSPYTPFGSDTPPATTPSNPSPYTPSAGPGIPPTTQSPKPSGAVTVSSGISHFMFIAVILMGFMG